MESDAPDKVVVSLSKSKLLFHFLGAVAFVVGGIWIWSIADTQKQFPPLFMKGVALANISFFGLCAIYGCSKLFDPRPGLIIDDQGIVDHSSAVAVGRILWCDCVALIVTEIVGQRFITILVLEPQKYTARGNFFARMLKVINTKMTGKPDQHFVNFAAYPIRRARSATNRSI